MKRVLIILCSIMLIVFALLIYNHYSGDAGPNRIDKVEEIRVKRKQKNIESDGETNEVRGQGKKDKSRENKTD